MCCFPCFLILEFFIVFFVVVTKIKQQQTLEWGKHFTENLSLNLIVEEGMQCNIIECDLDFTVKEIEIEIF